MKANRRYRGGEKEEANAKKGFDKRSMPMSTPGTDSSSPLLSFREAKRERKKFDIKNNDKCCRCRCCSIPSRSQCTHRAEIYAQKHFLIKCESRKRRKNVCRLDEARSVRGRGDEVPTEEKREEKRRKKRFQNVCGGGKIRGEKAASGG